MNRETLKEENWVERMETKQELRRNIIVGSILRSLHKNLREIPSLLSILMKKSVFSKS
jgi:hypothetical protein